MRLAVFAAALGIAGPAFADPLPQGRFMLAAQNYGEDYLPRYTVLDIDDTRLRIEFSFPLPLNNDDCDQTGNCVFETDAATASIDAVEGRVSLTDIALNPDALIEPGLMTRFGVSDHDIYTAPLLGWIDGARIELTEGGFTLKGGAQNLEFYAVTASAQDAIRVLPVFYEASIQSLGGCEVASIADLFAQGALDVGALSFQAALTTAARQLANDQALRRLAPLLAEQEPDAETQDEIRHLRLVGSIPQFLMAITDSNLEPEARIEQLWGIQGAALFEDRAAFDSAITSFGPGLWDLIAVMHHLRDTSPSFRTESICADPSLGYIDSF